MADSSRGKRFPCESPRPCRRRCPGCGAGAGAASLPALSRFHLGQTPPRSLQNSLNQPLQLLLAAALINAFPQSRRVCPCFSSPGFLEAAPSLIPSVPCILGGTQDITKKLALTRSVPELRGSPATPLALKKNSESWKFFQQKSPFAWWGNDEEGKDGGTHWPAPWGCPKLSGTPGRKIHQDSLGTTGSRGWAHTSSFS